MNFIAEYKKSLKPNGTEEKIDLFFYRPLGFLVAFFFRNSPRIKSNHISYLSMFSGILAGFFFIIKHHFVGIFFFNLSIVFDCADGQLARMQGSNTLYGRALDGMMDYIAFIFAYTGIGLYIYFIAYPEFSFYQVLFVGLIAGASLIIQARSLDYYRNIFAHSSDLASLEQELTDINRLQAESGMYRKFVYFMYSFYIKAQIKAFSKNQNISLRSVSLRTIYGTSSHAFLISICLLFYRVTPYLVVSMLVFNIYLLILKVRKI